MDQNHLKVRALSWTARGAGFESYLVLIFSLSKITLRENYLFNSYKQFENTCLDNDGRSIEVHVDVHPR